MKKKTVYLILLIVVIIAVLAYWFSHKNNQPKITAPTRASAGDALEVNAVVVKGQNFSNVITLSGSLEPNEQVQLRSEVSGIIRTLSFQEGTQVEKGQVLFSIDDSELQAQLLQAATTEKLAEENERRARLLLDKEAISAQEYDVANADYQSSKAQTQLIRAQLAKTKIKAPFSGRIGLRSVSAGEYLTPTTVVANLLSTNPVKLVFSIPEKYSAQIKKEQQISFTLSGSPQKYKARIYAIEPGIDITTRTLQIKALADNAGGDLVPGSFAQVEFPLAEVADAVLIPTEAVIPIQDGKQVFLSKGGIAKAVNIETENRTSSSILVISGISVGDTVLTTGIMSLKDGMKVKVSLGGPAATNTETK